MEFKTKIKNWVSAYNVNVLWNQAPIDVYSRMKHVLLCGNKTSSRGYGAASEQVSRKIVEPLSLEVSMTALQKADLVQRWR